MTDAPLIRVMALHALAYCERLFYLEEVEEIRVADAAVYAGRALHEELRQLEEEKGEWTSIELASEKLGLVGKMDALRRRDGSLIPYEHKKGRSWRGADQPECWPSDRLQIAAYALLLEEDSGQHIPEGRVRYHADNTLVRVPMDQETRRLVDEAVEKARTLRRMTRRPPVAGNDRLCLKCSLAPVCLPEEERLAADPEWKPVRLFPPDQELKTLHVTKPGARITRAGDSLKVTGLEEKDKTYPINEIGAVVCHGYPQITTQALHFCAYNEVAVHWLTGGGRYVTGLVNGAGSVHRRLRQYQAVSDRAVCLELARKVVTAKVEGALRYVLRATRGRERDADTHEAHLDMLRSSLRSVSTVDNLDSLRGHEGMAGKAYFALLPSFLKEQVPEAMVPKGRNRRPPRDCFNALLGFGYALLYQATLRSILAVGLEPALGFYHQPRSSAPTLVLDLMELFRIPVWDMVVVGSINRMQWDPANDFSVAGKRVWLSDTGRKKAIELFEKRLQDVWRHPVVRYSLSYSRLIELETRLLEKEWTGQPGLFARMRIR